MHGGSPSRYYQRFQILVLIRHILRVYTEWCYTCQWLNPSQYPPTEGSDSVDVATQVVRLHVTTAKAVSGPSYCLISHILSILKVHDYPPTCGEGWTDTKGAPNTISKARVVLWVFVVAEI